jgi:hypothetical protein
VPWGAVVHAIIASNVASAALKGVGMATCRR